MNAELQQRADWDEHLRLTLFDLKTGRLGAPVSDGGAANPLPLTIPGKSLHGRSGPYVRSVGKDRNNRHPENAASSSLADWIVPALVGFFLGITLYLTFKGVTY